MGNFFEEFFKGILYFIFHVIGIPIFIILLIVILIISLACLTYIVKYWKGILAGIIILLFLSYIYNQVQKAETQKKLDTFYKQQSRGYKSYPSYNYPEKVDYSNKYKRLTEQRQIKELQHKVQEEVYDSLANAVEDAKNYAAGAAINSQTVDSIDIKVRRQMEYFEKEKQQEEEYKKILREIDSIHQSIYKKMDEDAQRFNDSIYKINHYQ